MKPQKPTGNGSAVTGGAIDYHGALLSPGS